ncbi:MAG TPA: DUF4232 domain-containing protein [Streptosporangiaceae bacterium]|jgi:hypothetical protein
MLCAATAASLAVASCGSVRPGAAGRQAPAGCRALRVTLDVTAAGAAAGSLYLPIDFTNTSARRCQLAGYPRVTFTRGPAGAQIGAAAAADHATAPRQVTLAPGGMAHAWLRVASAANFPPRECRPVTAAGLLITAPGQPSASYLRHSLLACARVPRGGQVLAVQPVAPGRGRRGTAQ